MNASIAFILFAAAITPGPNNFVVMDTARRGLYAAVAPITGIVLGTLVLILVLRFGLDAAFSAHPKADSIMRVAGACVLGYLAIRSLVGRWSGPSASTGKAPARRALFFAMLSFQIANPKTWVLASAVSTTHASQDQASLLPLVLLTIFVPAGCLMVWGTIGQAFGRFFQKLTMQRALSLVLAFTFAVFAIVLVLSD
ncbi:MAG: LysE family translocator [Pseudomonadota bacterium]